MSRPAWIKDGVPVIEAYQLLKRWHYNVGMVYAWDEDSILYATIDGKPRTAWIKADPIGLVLSVHVVSGFEIEPPTSWSDSSSS